MRRWFYGLVALQMLFIVGEAVSYQVRRDRGREVLLKVVPRDPRSLFMGHYMTLGYEISTIDAARFHPGIRFASGQTVYVGVQPAAPYARLVDVRTDEPDQAGSTVYIRGKVESGYGSTINIAYGIERYYIPESREDEVNNMTSWRNNHIPKITVAASVASDGKAMIRRILVDGRALSY